MNFDRGENNLTSASNAPKLKSGVTHINLHDEELNLMGTTDDRYETEQLHRAAQDGNIDEVARLIREGFKVNKFDTLSRTPLHYAVEKEHYFITK